jgi:hypothetical protein
MARRPLVAAHTRDQNRPPMALIWHPLCLRWRSTLARHRLSHRSLVEKSKFRQVTSDGEKSQSRTMIHFSTFRPFRLVALFDLLCFRMFVFRRLVFSDTGLLFNVSTLQVCRDKNSICVAATLPMSSSCASEGHLHFWDGYCGCIPKFRHNWHHHAKRQHELKACNALCQNISALL